MMSVETREALKRQNHPYWPFVGPTRAELTDDEFRYLLLYWYGLAGYRLERYEYTVTPEAYGSGGKNEVAHLEDLSEAADEDIFAEFEEVITDEFVWEISDIAGLTSRERQVVEWIAVGNVVIGVDFVEPLALALGVSRSAARRYKSTALAKLREYWANDMTDAGGLVDPRYLKPVQANEFVCAECHLVYHQCHESGDGRCTECEEQ